MRELRSGVWTDWSAPYTFTIRADDTQIVLDWLWDRYDHVGDQYDGVSAIIDLALDGVYSYGYAGGLLIGLYESLGGWGDALGLEPLPALRGDQTCTLARNWVALNGKDLALLAGWWGLSFQELPVRRLRGRAERSLG